MNSKYLDNDFRDPRFVKEIGCAHSFLSDGRDRM